MPTLCFLLMLCGNCEASSRASSTKKNVSMPLDASRFNCISSNISGKLYCTVYRLNDCKEAMLRLFYPARAIVRIHRLPSFPILANSACFS